MGACLIMERESSVKISATVYKQLEQQSKSVAYTDNGTYNVSPDPGYFLSNVNVEVHVDQNLSVISELSAVISGLNDQIATITSLTIVENGTYTPPEGVLGYNSINVSIGGGEMGKLFDGLKLGYSTFSVFPYNVISHLSNLSNMFPGSTYTGTDDIIIPENGFPEATNINTMMGALSGASSVNTIIKKGAFPKITSVTGVESSTYGHFVGDIICVEDYAFGQSNYIAYMGGARLSCSPLAFSNAYMIDPLKRYTDVVLPGLKNAHTLWWTFSETKMSEIIFPDTLGENVTKINFNSTFANTTALTKIVFPSTVPVLSFGYYARVFYKCTALETLEIYNIANGTIQGPYDGFTYCTKLTVDSLMNIINALPVTTNRRTLGLGTTNLSKLSEEQIAIATNKGWTLN